MKVVVNKCFGGFGISTQALKELVLRKAKCINETTPEEYYGGVKRNWEQSWKKDMVDYTEIGDGFRAHKHQYNIYKDGILYDLKSSYENEVRSDADLVEVVEKMKEASFGNFAKLEVVEIPNGIQWSIDNYDGMESVEEAHRSW